MHRFVKNVYRDTKRSKVKIRHSHRHRWVYVLPNQRLQAYQTHGSTAQSYHNNKQDQCF